MAFIYRYQIVIPLIRSKVNLKYYEEDIICIIESFFSTNLKDCRVEIDYFEFKLHYSADNSFIRQFGRVLLDHSLGLQAVKYKYNIKKGLFRRIEQCFYAFPDESVLSSSEKINIMLIDALEFNETKRLLEQSENYFGRYFSRSQVYYEYSDTDFAAIKKVFIWMSSAYRWIKTSIKILSKANVLI